MKKIISILLCISMLLGMAAFVTAAEKNTNISVNISDYASKKGWANSTKYPSIKMDDNITVTATGGSNTGKYYTSGNQWRIYQTESPKVTVAASSGTIKTVKITYTVEKNGILTHDGKNIASGTSVTVNASSVTFGVGNSGSDTKGQVRITAIEVVYSTSSSGSGEGGGEVTPPAACDHTDKYTCSECGWIADPTEVEDILKCLYALEPGQSIPSAKTLTGKVTKIDTAWSDQFSNITVTMEVEGFPDMTVVCFRLKNSPATTTASTIKVGDTITVTGTLTNYNGTREFNSGCTLEAHTVNHTCVSDKYAWNYNFHWLICSCGAPETKLDEVAHKFIDGKCECGISEPAMPFISEENHLVAGSAYKLALYQLNLGKQFYATGAMDGYYYQTTEDIASAADVYIEETEGGYHLTIKVDGATKYLNITSSGTHINVTFDDTATSVFTWDDTNDTFVTVVGEESFFFGTYNNYDTFSANNIDKFSTNFISHLICTHNITTTEGAIEATCTTPGYTGDEVCAACKTLIKPGIETAVLKHTRPEPEKACINQNCTVCGKDIPADEKHINTVIPAVPATCTNTGLTEGKKCTVCGTITVKQEEVPVANHSWNDATCITPKTCSVCGLTEGEALGHHYVNKKCDRCGADEPACKHEGTIVVDTAKAPTCTETGLTEGKHCSACNEVLVAQTTIKALGHTEVIDAGKAPTCTATGLTEGKHCSVCNTVTVKQEVIAAKGHTEVIDAAKAPTCTATGLTEGKHCSVCNEVIVAQQVVPAKNHTPGDPATCTTAQTCTSCQAVLVAATGHSFTNGKCTVCQAADPDYVAPTEPETTEPETTEPAGDGNTTSSNVLGDNGWENGKVKDSFSIGSNVTVSVSATPVGEWGQNSGKFYDSDKTWRIYQNESPAITVAAGTGKIVSVKVTYETKNDGILTLNGKNIESGAVVEVDAASVVFGVANTGDKTNGQVKITAIEVIHTGPASSTPDATEPEETKPEETKPEETKPEETKPEETKPEETKPEATDPAPENPEFSIVTKPAASEPFKFGMTQKNLENAVYYLKGGMDGYYMATTTDINEAIDVYLEETEGGFYLYTMVDGTKTYINMVVSGTHVNGAYEAAASTVYTLKNGTLVATVEVEGEAAEYWFGTRNDKQYTTMGPCKTSYEGFYGQFYGTSNPETADTFSSIVFALMALSAIGAGVVISKKKEF